MPRRYRFVVDNAYYHILNRGNNKQKIFKEKEDYEKFLEMMKEYFNKLGIEIIHYVLMTNHYHIIVRIKEAESLKKGLQQINQRYARYYKKKYGGVGYFWQGRYKSFVIETGKYLLECSSYIELNPVRAGMVKNAGEYEWSSYKVYGEGYKDNEIGINPEYESLSDNLEKRKELYREYLKERLSEKRKLERYYKSGVCGSDEFKNRMEKQGLVSMWSHGGRPKKKNDNAKT